MTIDLFSRARGALNDSRSSGSDDESGEQLRAVVDEAVREALADAEAERGDSSPRFARTRKLFLFGAGVALGYKLAARDPPLGSDVDVSGAQDVGSTGSTASDSGTTVDVGETDSTEHGATDAEAEAESSGSWALRLLLFGGLTALAYALNRRRQSDGGLTDGPEDLGAASVGTGAVGESAGDENDDTDDAGGLGDADEDSTAGDADEDTETASVDEEN
jgi:hypothetical protein